MTAQLMKNLNTEKLSDFEYKEVAASIGNFTEWINAVVAYIDDMFIFASSMQ